MRKSKSKSRRSPTPRARQRSYDRAAARARALQNAGTDSAGTREFTGFTPTPPIPAPIVGVARPKVVFLQFLDCAAVFVNGHRDAVLRDESTAVYSFCQTLARLGVIEFVKIDNQHLTFLA